MRNGWQIQEDDMIEEHLENHLHEGEEEHMHTHVLEDGTTVMHSHSMYYVKCMISPGQFFIKCSLSLQGTGIS